jgi:addiction module HigA family antidote
MRQQRAPTHPGELTREMLDERRLSIAEAARRMKVSRASLHAVFAGRTALSPLMAMRFARLTGGSAELLIQMQARLDLWKAEERWGPRVAAEVDRARARRPSGPAAVSAPRRAAY